MKILFQHLLQFWRRLLSLLYRGRFEREMEEEIRFHLEMQIEQNLEYGMTTEEARQAAQRQFGNQTWLKEVSRDMWSMKSIETLIQDLRFGTRLLVKNPAFSLIAVITLALGIGANTAIFSVVNGVLLRPLPYEEPEGLVWLSEAGKKSGRAGPLSYPNFADWRAQNGVFEKIGFVNTGDYNLTGNGEAERLRAVQMSADLFGALRVKAMIGRVYTNDEDKPGANPVVVLSHGLWQRRFSNDPNIVGRTLALNERNYTVIGVMPEGFLFPTGERVEMWVPVGPLSDQGSWKLRVNRPGMYAVARLKPGVTLEQARADMMRITAALETQYPDANQDAGALVVPLLERFVSDIRRTLYLLLGAVGFVLLIACANVASLTLARAAARQKEMAVRTALGANRWRIVRQLLTESVLLALLGGGLGLLIARWSVTAILAISPEGTIPRIAEINLDQSVLLFTVAVSILTGIVFGLAPALQSSRPDVQETLKETTGSMTGRRRWLRSGMVIIEIALTLVLLIGAGLLIRSFLRLQQVNPGFSTENTLRFKVSLPAQKYPGLDKTINFFTQVIEKIEALPGVQSVGLSSSLPLGNDGWKTIFTLVDRPDPPLSDTPRMEACRVDIGYFETLRIPLVRGRQFNEQDNRSPVRPEDLTGKPPIQQYFAGLRTIIIDEEFARRYFSGEDPIGKQIRLGRSIDPWARLLTVVGVVGRVKTEGLRNNKEIVQGYFPFREIPVTDMIFTVRAQIPPEQLMASVRSQVQAVDPNQPIFDVSTLEETRVESVAPERLILTLIGVFAAVALVLALVGIYGVVSWSVTQRTHEIGVRMALGAREGDVLRLVLGQGMKLVIIGIGIGLAGALGLTRFMKALLFDVSATDTTTFVSVVLLLVSVALLACFIPARRATKIDTFVTLRSE
jgi:putative ABC transport system permease protein